MILIQLQNNHNHIIFSYKETLNDFLFCLQNIYYAAATHIIWKNAIQMNIFAFTECVQGGTSRMTFLPLYRRIFFAFSLSW